MDQPNPLPPPDLDLSDTRAARPFGGFEWMLALRYLRPRRRRWWPLSLTASLSFVGVMLGVAVLIVVMSVMNGFRHELLDRIFGLSGHVFLQPYERPLTDYRDVVGRVGSLPEVRAVFPILEGMALAAADGRSTGVMVRGMRGEDVRATPPVASNLVEGGLDGFDGQEGVAVGAELAATLRLRVGDTVSLLIPEGETTPFGTVPKQQDFPVAAVFHSKKKEYDAMVVYMPLPTAQAFYGRADDVNQIEIHLRDADAVASAREGIHRVVGRPVFMNDWRDRDRQLVGALRMERNVMFLILSLIVLVATINIMSSMVMLVKDKRADIAILRTMGTTRGAILRVFLISGSLVGALGAGGGMALGLFVAPRVDALRQLVLGRDGLSAEIYVLSRLPSLIDPMDVLIVTLSAFAAALLATLYPSWSAARTDPVETLRHG